MGTKHAIHTTGDLMKFLGFLKVQELPITVSVRAGVDRSISQNALAHKWFNEIATWLGDRDASEVRAYCKLNHGVKMLVTEDEEFRDKWHNMVKDRFNYEEKLALMLEPFDFPVTRLMSVKQMTRFMDAIYREFSAQGVPLTVPDDLKYAEEMGR